MTTSELLLHPVRLRIVQAFLGDRALTTGELGEALPDVPQASLYRHVGLLADAGVLVVDSERKVRGAAERRYRLVPAAASVGPEEAAGLTVEEHRRAFATFVAGLLADYDRYLERAGADGGGLDVARDGIGYRQTGLWLTDAEFAQLLEELRAALRSRLAHQPGDGRRRRLVSTVFLPG